MNPSDRKSWCKINQISSLGRTVLVCLLIPAFLAASPFRQAYNQIKVTPEKISIEIDNVSLAEVLNNIESKSGIGFDVPYAMRNQIIDAHVQAHDWKGALSILLEEFSRIDIWEGDQLKTVYLLKSNRTADFFPSEAPVAPPQRTQGSPQEPVTDEKAILLTQDQARKLFAGGFRSPLSNKLLLDPELKEFLAGYGIENEEDLKDVNKAKSVRREARKAVSDPDQKSPRPEKLNH